MGFSRYLTGSCPNPQCKQQLLFPSHEASVECTACGRRYSKSNLQNLKSVEFGLQAIQQILTNLQKESQRSALVSRENLKVNGLSNYLCTILSTLLTVYGMDKTTGRARPLTQMGKSAIFDCAHLGDRAFLIEPQHLLVPGYGRDRSGSHMYLKGTLERIKAINDNEERLVPIHADGDGHCLVHAISRALVGWELFWHPLRVNLKQHFIENINKYKLQFKDFVDESDWDLIINECDPEFIPTGAEPTGLRNIHIFGLANVLKRPIVLLDSLEGIKSSGDYSAIFLPYFSPPSECQNKEGVLNKPLCIAWSSLGRNHFIPLVGISGKKCPVLSRHMINRAWGISDSEIDKYVTFDQQGNFQIGGEKSIQLGYLQRLVAAMSDIFYQEYGVSPALVADVYQQVFKCRGLMFGLNLNLLLEKIKHCVEDRHLYICLSCQMLSLPDPVNPECLLPGGELFNLAVNCYSPLKDGESYTFPLHGNIVTKYSASQNKLIFDDSQRGCDNCSNGVMRLVRADYSIQYKNGDRTFTRSTLKPNTFKYFFNGQEYDHLPKQIPVLMDWGGRRLETKVMWFQDEEDASLNSNVYTIAMNLVQENFPGEFGSERLVQKVVDQILLQTRKPETEQAPLPSATAGSNDGSSVDGDMDDPNTWSPHRASKAILLGMQRQSIHREELNKSAAERQLKQRIESNASKQQRRLSDQLEKKHSPSPEPVLKKTPDKQSPQPATSRTSSSYTGAGVTSPVTPVNESSFPQDSDSKRVRLSTSDGRNLTLELPSDCTFLQLQSLIQQATGTSPHHQCIRYGFPPKELKPPASLAEDYKVPVQPGDKIILNILLSSQDMDHSSNKISGQTPQVQKNTINSLPVRKEEPTWNSLAEGSEDEVSDRVLQRLMDQPWATGGDILDHTLSALALTAALDNKDFWTYAQHHPHLFSVNGLIYKQVERDVGLKHGKHCQVPLLPRKVFVYNQHDDRLELCLEPYGHFPVVYNVEKNVSSLLPSSKCSNKAGHQPFSGQGHLLRSSSGLEERMPTDVPMSPKRNEARKLNTMCDPTKHQESIEEEDEPNLEDMKDIDSSSTLAGHSLLPSLLTRSALTSRSNFSSLVLPNPEVKLVRKGPGYSELSPIPENVVNEKAAMFNQLISSMEQAWEDHESQQTIDSETERNHSLTHAHLSQGSAAATSSSSFQTCSSCPKLPTPPLGPNLPPQESWNHSNDSLPMSSMFPSSSRTVNEVVHNQPCVPEYTSPSPLTSLFHGPTQAEDESNVSMSSAPFTFLPNQEEFPISSVGDHTPETVLVTSGSISERTGQLDVTIEELNPSKCEHEERVSYGRSLPEDGQVVIQMDTDLMKDDSSPIEDEETSRREQASELDDLFIVERPANSGLVSLMERSANSGLGDQAEDMDSQ